MSASRSLGEIEAQLAVPPGPGEFSESQLDGLPKGARKMLGAAIEPGTPLAAAAQLQMRGSIKLNRWLPFRARQVIAPGIGFIWRARVAGIISGYDRSFDGHGEMRWKLANLFTVSAGSGPDVSRSAAGREAGEAFWVPTTLLPGSGARWLEADAGRAVARFSTVTEDIDVTYGLNSAGQVTSVAFARWGDPENSGEFALHTFGGAMSDHRSFGGVTIPSRGVVGWHFGEPGWSAGEFFRFQITDLQLVE